MAKASSEVINHSIWRLIMYSSWRREYMTYKTSWAAILCQGVLIVHVGMQSFLEIYCQRNWALGQPGPIDSLTFYGAYPSTFLPCSYTFLSFSTSFLASPKNNDCLCRHRPLKACHSLRLVFLNLMSLFDHLLFLLNAFFKKTTRVSL